MTLNHIGNARLIGQWVQCVLILVGGVRLSPAVNIVAGQADKRAMMRSVCTLPYAVIVSTKYRSLLIIKVNDRPMCKLFCPLPVCGGIA